MNLNYTISGICKGITKAGNPCKHRVIFANGFCKQHGGATPPEVIAERAKAEAAKVERLKQKYLRQAKKWRSKFKGLFK